MATTLKDTIDYHFETMYSIEGLFEASQKVERPEFQIFIQGLLERHTGIQALEWVPRVTHEQRSFYEAAARRDGFAEFQITERGSEGQVVAAARRSVYFPVYYVEPYRGNESVLGFDMASNAQRRTAIDHARDTGQLTATARLTLVQERGQQYGVVIFLPVYGQQASPDTAAARRAGLRGFVLGVFRIGDMVTAALKAFETDTISYALHDLTVAVGQQLLWEHDPGARSNAGTLTRVRPAAGLSFRSRLDVGGRNWAISFAPTFGYLASQRSWDVGAVLAGGLLFSSLVGALLLAISGRSAELSAANTRLQSEISERVQTEARLYESRQKFRGLIESAPDAILIVDHQGKVTFANPQFESVFGYRIGEILGQPHDILLPERLREVHAVHRANYRDAPYTRLMGEGLELFGRRKDGSQFPVEIGLSTLQMNQERGVICIVRDISERKRSEDALREREAQLWQIIDLVPHMIFAKDAEGRFVLVNRFMAEAYGTHPKKLSGSFQADYHRDREELAQFLSGDRRVLETGQSQFFPKMTFTDAHGKQRILQVTKIPFRAAGTQAAGVLGVAVDITDLNRIEEALKESQAALETKVEARTRELKLAMQKAQEADQLKSAFLASMSHELRTPLNSIIGFTGLLLQGIVGPLNDEQQKQLGMVQNSARHLLSLINEVLDLSKIEAGQLEVAHKRFHVKEAIEKVMQTVGPLADKKSLALKAEVAPDVGQITGDRKRLEQILINLVNNAVKFTEKGEVRVDCRIAENRLVIKVTDTGIGIKPQDMNRIFQAFHQLDSGLARRYEGTGLGLHICRKLTQLLEGDISAESQGPGKGSTFTVRLPV
jgi:PAS domain S-box-containing protein